MDVMVLQGIQVTRALTVLQENRVVMVLQGLMGLRVRMANPVNLELKVPKVTKVTKVRKVTKVQMVPVVQTAIPMVPLVLKENLVRQARLDLEVNPAPMVRKEFQEFQEPQEAQEIQEIQEHPVPKGRLFTALQVLPVLLVLPVVPVVPERPVFGVVRVPLVPKDLAATLDTPVNEGTTGKCQFAMKSPPLKLKLEQPQRLPYVLLEILPQVVQLFAELVATSVHGMARSVPLEP